ncbi:trehalose-phosphatase TPS2 [Sugiyamaella lignohabitans]|uniref:Trehalose-phosphatase TPS2 n=1 Tax=Sugiyamaella lignohabitans TaxID=796027 RepID=A0A167CI15_9ASCO|nr:trehalose-phosphatase TPS2 [Sugiyamaella lignohabitans]ANB11726.1 trehalose-phosphatase TPS2 [Sugiyamaella lignohabitans]
MSVSIFEGGHNASGGWGSAPDPAAPLASLESFSSTVSAISCEAGATGSGAEPQPPEAQPHSHLDRPFDEDARNLEEQEDEEPADVEPLNTPQAARGKGIETSGRIISAVTNLPWEVVDNGSGGPDALSLQSRRGNSALFSSLSYIHEGTEWDSILVGWTGEVKAGNVAPSEPGHPVLLEDKDLLTREFDDSEKERLNHLYNEIANGNNPGCSGSESESKNESKNGSKTLTMHPVWLPGNQSKWRAYPEQVVWPILHYIQDENKLVANADGNEMKKWWADYVAFNEAYRDKILEIYQPGDVIWIHDYYLLLLPQMIRMRRPDAFIGTFIHAPFPSSEYFRCIPQRKELLESVLGSNLIGLQAASYKRHFISSCTRLLGVESSPNHINAFGMYVSVQSLPIGIDTTRVEHDAFSPEIDERVQAIRDLYPDKKIIVGRDRLDSVRGVVQKLQGFEMFLDMYPEWSDKVVLFQVTSPAYSFTDAKVEKRASELISRINANHGMLHFMPVHHHPRHVARDEYLALLRVADLGLITSVRDGMNTTLLEFVVCQKENKSPVITSEFTGTTGSLHNAISVNPWNIRQVAETIHDALQDDEATKESHARLQNSLYEYVTTHTCQDWVLSFISRLMHNISEHKFSHVTPMLDTSRLVAKYKAAKTRRLFLFDYDGTLTPIVNEPSAALPSKRLYSILDQLTADPCNSVWVISGRDQKFLDKWLGTNKKISFSAEHGCFLKEAEGTGEWQDLVASIDMSWQKVVAEIFNNYTERTQGSSVEHKRAALTWHYRRADPDFGALQAQHLRNHLEQSVVPYYDVDVMAGKANIEVRPSQFNKGEIVKRIMAEYDDSNHPQLVFCVGDDSTDEDMFRALENYSAEDGVFSVTVGPPSKMTVASYHLLDPAQVLDSLSALF